jgi:ubiquinone/menaquinone biosynthesis C-methylase UbiE
MMRKHGHPLVATLYDGMTRPLEKAVLAERRARLLGELTGDILEVGAGTGANLPYYCRADRVVAAEPDPAMRKRLVGKLDSASVPVDISDAAGESLPHADGSFDAVVCTLVLCTVADLPRTLAEARRVLGPQGRLVVLEHVRGTGRLAAWQDWITPLWSRLTAGCHPNRDIGSAIEKAGLTFRQTESFTAMPGWFPTSPMLAAVAVRSG